MQIGGAGIIIVGIYTATVSKGNLPPTLYFSLVVLAVFAMIFSYVVLEVAAKVLFKSKAFIGSVRK